MYKAHEFNKFCIIMDFFIWHMAQPITNGYVNTQMLVFHVIYQICSLHGAVRPWQFSDWAFGGHQRVWKPCIHFFNW